MKDRIKAVRKDLKMTQAQFGEIFGIGKMSVTYYENGTRNMPDSSVFLLKERYGINPEWLKDGVGEMYLPKDESDEIAEITAKMFHESDPLRRKLAKLVFELDEEDMKALKRIWAKIKDIDGQ